VCFNDYDREIALVAEEVDPAGERQIVAIARLSKAHALPTAEFAVLVGDRWQRRGLGGELLRRLVRVGRAEGLERICADMLASNVGMRLTAESVGFTIIEQPGAPTVSAELRLDD
jgi:acetyltransferase